MELFGGASQAAAPSTAQSPEEVFARVCMCVVLLEEDPGDGQPVDASSWSAPGSTPAGCCEPDPEQPVSTRVSAPCPAPRDAAGLGEALASALWGQGLRLHCVQARLGTLLARGGRVCARVCVRGPCRAHGAGACGPSRAPSLACWGAAPSLECLQCSQFPPGRLESEEAWR